MLSLLLRSLLALLMSFFILGATRGWAQSKINFKVIPVLQPMKEVAPTPDFSLLNPAGQKISLKDFRGKTVFLNFWATWCVPCREEMPAMEKLYQEYKDKNFVVLGVKFSECDLDSVALLKYVKIASLVAFDSQAEVLFFYRVWRSA